MLQLLLRGAQTATRILVLVTNHIKYGGGVATVVEWWRGCVQ